ncbi:MAG: DNA polymerase III subunit gamma/tau, partial [Acidimicrobiales bacterium]
MTSDPSEPEPYQSLYRRFRPQRFAEVRGQGHVTAALASSVRDQRVSHAYLFSGPRGTGKTSTARILAKALNCATPLDGEPCGVCPSCVAVTQGASLDVHELDAASNNGVDAMRDLVARAALATPGRSKVYIVDEVHMLSTAASNTLLKTLEEPPAHVTFVLATTDPQKILPTIRSRTQHFEFRLLGPADLAALVADVNTAAGLGLAAPALDAVTRRGRGSARDALSALDQVAAAGPDATTDEASDAEQELVEGLCERDAGRCLRAVAVAVGGGRDPRRIATELLEELRELFLATTAPELSGGDATDQPRRMQQAARLGPAGLLRAMEALGQAVIDMRDALEPRVTLEVAVVRLAQPDVDVSRAAVLERLERLERRVAGLGDGLPAAPAGPIAAAPAASTAEPGAASPGSGARAALGALRPRTGTHPAAAAPAAAPARPPADA